MNIISNVYVLGYTCCTCMMYKPTAKQTVAFWSLFKGFRFFGPVFKAAYKYLNKESDTLWTDSTMASFSNRS
jgi:hypothetical protein